MIGVRNSVVIRIAVCVGVLISPVSSVNAHRLAATTTELTWIPDTQQLEVVHSIHLDDAVRLLATLGSADGNLTPLTQARLLLYFESQFSLNMERGPVQLEPVGAQIDGDYLWVYQESTIKQFPEQLQVTASLLHEYSPETQNFVHLAVGDAVRSTVVSVIENSAVF